MKLRIIFFWVILNYVSGIIYCQDNVVETGGFIRAGIYPGIDESTNKPDFPTAFSDIGINAEYGNEINFKAFAELQYRYGTEYGTTVSRFKLREGYITFYGNKWDVSAGQKIIRWGRTDFSNPTSKVTPRDLLLRTTDRDEIYTGNLLGELNYHPFERLRLQFVTLPLYRSSTLLIDPVPLPSYINFKLINSLITRNVFSYGLRADLYLNSFDLGIAWFDGYDPMPGISLQRFEIHNTGGFPVPLIDLQAVPYHINMAGLDFETTAGAFGFRGEAAWVSPVEDYLVHEHIPLPHLEFAAGSDWSRGNWRLSAEYGLKYMYDYTPPQGESLIGSDPDLSVIGQLISMPGFDLYEFIRTQVATFNRLYNYQAEKTYHSAGLRIEADLMYGKLTPSLYTMYNFTAGEIVAMPEIRFKPADGITLVAGAEYYRGKKGSLFRIIDSFMNSLYFTARVDF